MNEITWGIPVAVDLFFAGLGAGSFCLAALACRKKGPGWEACSRMASFLAPLSIVIGLSMLILDLRSRFRFWMTLTVFHWQSPMSVGTWLLTAFFLVSCLFALYELPAPVRQRIPVIGTLPIWNRPASRNRIGIIGIALALGVSVYTGVLLSASRLPLWRNLSLPFLFFVSAIATGFAGGAALGMLALRTHRMEAMGEPLQHLRGSYLRLLPLYFLAALLYVFSIDPFLTGWNLWIWWTGVVGIGILIPLILVISKKALSTRRAWVLFSCLLIGGFLLRTVLVLAGQQF
jgi:polysulfide reductase chain C